MPAIRNSSADPVMVDQIVKSLGLSMQDAVIPGITTSADIISALFTVLHHVLMAAQRNEEPEDREPNAREISRVLMDFLLEFGSNETKN